MKDDESKKKQGGAHAPAITPEGITVRVGQVWKDMDKRMDNRLLTVVSIVPGGPVILRQHGATRTTKVRLDRLRAGSTGYTLVSG